jgi:hypothetical protein
VERKVIETVKIRVVWTVSVGGYVEKQPPSKGKKPSREAKTTKSVKQLPECTAFGRPLGEE